MLMCDYCIDVDSKLLLLLYIKIFEFNEIFDVSVRLITLLAIITFNII